MLKENTQIFPINNSIYNSVDSITLSGQTQIVNKLKESIEVDIEWSEETKATTTDVSIFGVLMLSCSIMYGWNSALVYGLGPWALALMCMSFSYMVTFNSIAEISSCIPFNGVSYGLARVFLGFYPGFMVGAFQWLESIIYSAALVLYTSQNITQYMNCSKEWQVLIWVIHYGFATIVMSMKGRWLFSLNIKYFVKIRT